MRLKKLRSRKIWALSFALLFFISGALLLLDTLAPEKTTPEKFIYSSELNIADSSPLGSSFGLVVPASCPSNLHDDSTYGAACTSEANNCGHTNSGTYQCGGICSATQPDDVALSGTASCADVAGTYGVPATHTVGTANWTQDCSGNVTYTGGCSEPACVPTSDCTPSNICAGVSCNDGCNTYTGTKDCSVTYSCGGNAPDYSTIYSGDDTGLTSAANFTRSATNTSAKCEFECNLGHYWNGSSCPASCPAENTYTETNQSSIAAYCNAQGVTCGTGYAYTNLSCHSRVGSWDTFGATCTAPYCTGCGCRALTPPSTPTGLQASCNESGNQATLSWNAVSGASSYHVRLNNTNNDSASCWWGWLCSTPPDYSDDFYTSTSKTYPVNPGQPYGAWVHAYNADGTSTAVSTGFTCNPPTPVTTFTGSSTVPEPDQTNQTTLNLPAGGGSVNLNWSITNGAGGGSCTGYSTTGVSGWAVGGTGGKPTTGTNIPVTVSSTTRFDLDCWNGNGTAAERESVTVNVAVPAPVTTFTGTYSTQTNQTTLNLPSTGGTVDLNWSVTNATGGTCTGYSTTGVAGWATAGTGSKPVSGASSVNVSSTTRFDLDCRNSSGTAATRESVTVNVAPAAPTGFTAICNAAGNQVTLSWNTVSSASSYFVRLDQIAGNSSACTDGWYCSTPPDYYTDFYVPTTQTYPVTSGQSYSSWVHSYNTSGVSTATAVAFTCNASTLKICQNSCSSNIQVSNGTTISMNDTDPSRNYVACYSPASGCNDSTGSANVTSGTTWGESGSNAVSVSGNNPKVVTPNTLSSPGTLTENITATYSGNTSSFNVAVTKFCASGCTAVRDAAVCTGDTYTETSPTPGCGTVTSTCNGIRVCDFNWTEVAP